MISQVSPVDAWKEAATQLLAQKDREAFNVLVSFPAGAAADESAMESHDPRTFLGSGFDRARDVANTIFPQKTWDNSDSRPSFYKRYALAHARGKKKGWGTYFGRFIAFGQKNVNQLERVVQALEKWEGVHRAAFFMHSSSAETDGLRTRGGPCLQYVQFCCPNSKQIDLVAVYRNHDYCNKVLGNYFGLSRLLRFVCDETEHEVGTVSCLSVHAYSATSLTNMKKLLGIP